jgi:hypothetical protein
LPTLSRATGVPPGSREKKEETDSTRGVLDANSIEHVAAGVLELKLRVVFVSITDGNCVRDKPPRGAQRPTECDSSAQGGAVILSNRWSQHLECRFEESDKAA